MLFSRSGIMQADSGWFSGQRWLSRATETNDSASAHFTRRVSSNNFQIWGKAADGLSSKMVHTYLSKEGRTLATPRALMRPTIYSQPNTSGLV